MTQYLSLTHYSFIPITQHKLSINTTEEFQNDSVGAYVLSHEYPAISHAFRADHENYHKGIASKIAVHNDGNPGVTEDHMLVDNGNRKSAEEGLIAEQYKHDDDDTNATIIMKTKTRFLKLPLDPASLGEYLATSNSDWQGPDYQTGLSRGKELLLKGELRWSLVMESHLDRKFPVIRFYVFYEIPIVDITKKDNTTFHTPKKAAKTNPDIDEFDKEFTDMFRANPPNAS